MSQAEEYTKDQMEAMARRNAANNIRIFESELAGAPLEVLINAVDMSIANAERIYGPKVGEENLKYWHDVYMAKMMPWLAGRAAPKN